MKNDTATNTSTDEINTLTEEIDDLTRKLKSGGFDAETWREIATKTDLLTTAKNRARHEQSIMEVHRRRFLDNSFGSEDDFNRIWAESMRDEVMRKEADTLTKLRQASNHRIYQDY